MTNPNWKLHCCFPKVPWPGPLPSIIILFHRLAIVFNAQCTRLGIVRWNETFVPNDVYIFLKKINERVLLLIEVQIGDLRCTANHQIVKITKLVTLRCTAWSYRKSITRASTHWYSSPHGRSGLSAIEERSITDLGLCWRSPRALRMRLSLRA